MWLLLLSCARTPDVTDPASPAGRLAAKTGSLGRESRTLAIEISELDGLFDRIRTAPPEERAAIAADIRARTAAIKTRATELRDYVSDIEAAAQVY